MQLPKSLSAIDTDCGTRLEAREALAGEICTVSQLASQPCTRLTSGPDIAKPALTGAAIAVLVETVLCLLLTFRLIYPFATYISNSSAVSAIVQHMWRSIDWCYVIGYALSTLLATILVATRPILYLISSLLSNILYVLPWTIAIQYVAVKPGNEWFYCEVIPQEYR